MNQVSKRDIELFKIYKWKNFHIWIKCKYINQQRTIKPSSRSIKKKSLRKGRLLCLCLRILFAVVAPWWVNYGRDGMMEHHCSLHGRKHRENIELRTSYIFSRCIASDLFCPTKPMLKSIARNPSKNLSVG